MKKELDQRKGGRRGGADRRDLLDRRLTHSVRAERLYRRSVMDNEKESQRAGQDEEMRRNQRMCTDMSFCS